MHDERPRRDEPLTPRSTERRAAEETLRLSEERFRLLVDSVVDYAIFMLDTDGRIATWNRGAERLKGYYAAEIIGRHFRTLYPPEAAASGHPEEELERARRDGRYEEEGWRMRKDGTRFWASVVITALHHPSDARVTGFAKVTRDLTARRRAEEDLTVARRRLAETEKLSALGMLVSGVAHEVRTPLTYVRNNVSLLRLRLQEGSSEALDGRTLAEMTTLADSALDGVGRINRVVEDLRRFARAVPGDRVSVRLGDVVQGAVSLFESTHPAQVNVRASYRDDGVVVVDPIRIQQVALNLMENAAEAMPRGGTIRVETRSAEGSVEIVVSDEGSGISEADRHRIFEPFFTTKAAGLGLGLSIVRRIVEEHQGTLRLDDRGKGTTIVVSLPTATKAASLQTP